MDVSKAIDYIQIIKSGCEGKKKKEQKKNVLNRITESLSLEGSPWDHLNDLVQLKWKLKLQAEICG